MLLKFIFQPSITQPSALYLIGTETRPSKRKSPERVLPVQREEIGPNLAAEVFLRGLWRPEQSIELLGQLLPHSVPAEPISTNSEAAHAHRITIQGRRDSLQANAKA